MGLNVGMNALTSGGLGLSTVLFVVMGILLVNASRKVAELPEFESSSELKKANSDLKTAYALIFIAAGITLLLAIAYGGHEVAWCPSEWIHSLLFFLLMVALVIGIIYAYIALNDLYHPEIENTNGSTAYIWASLLIGAIAFMVTAAVGSGRIGYNAARGDVKKRVHHAEDKLHELHSHVTGKPNDFVREKGRCDSEDPEVPCGQAPVPVMVQQPQQGYQSQAPQQSYQSQTYQPPQYQVQQSMPQTQINQSLPQSPVRLPTVNQNQPTQRFVGNPTVTSHSVVTTSQPVVTSSSPRQGFSQMSQQGFPQMSQPQMSQQGFSQMSQQNF